MRLIDESLEKKLTADVNNSMPPSTNLMLGKVKKLQALDEEAKQIRTDLRISHPLAIIYRAAENICSDSEVIVVADGYGGATLIVTQGNYPIDYFAKRQQHFESEDEACEEAEGIVLK